MEKSLEEAFAAFREAPEDERAALGDFIRRKMHAEPRLNAPDPGAPNSGAPALRAEPPVETPAKTAVVEAPAEARAAGPGWREKTAAPAVERPAIDRPFAERPVLILRVEDMCAAPSSAPPRLGDWGADWLADWRGFEDGDSAEDRADDGAEDRTENRTEAAPSEAQHETPPSPAPRPDEQVSADPAPETRPAPDHAAARPAASGRRMGRSGGAEIIDIFGAGANQGEFRRLFSRAQ